MHASTVALTLFAASQAIAAPTLSNKARSIDAIGNAIGDFAEDVLGDHTAKRDELDARSLSAIEGVIDNIFHKRSLKAVGAAVAGGAASGVAGAVGNAVLNNKRSDSGIMVDTDTGVIYMDIPDANGARSLKAVGAAVAGGVASGVAGAVGNAVLGNKRSEPSGLMVDTETGTLYMDVPDVNKGRSLKAVGAAVAGGVASGVAGAVGNAVLGNKRAEPSGLMIDTETGTLYMDVPDAQDARSLSAIEGVVNDIFGKRSLSAIENFLGNLKRDEIKAINQQLSKILQRSDLVESMSRRSIDDLE